jgi:hypothetical protein
MTRKGPRGAYPRALRACEYDPSEFGHLDYAWCANPGTSAPASSPVGLSQPAPEERLRCTLPGCQHAGENLAEVIRRRAPDLGAPILMCDAASRNVPKLSEGVAILVANCLAHGRRQFVEVAQSFPQQCRYVLEALGRVYYHDAQVREHSLSAQERLRFHQQHSAPVMEELHGWLQAQLAQKKTEPNSALGQGDQLYAAPLERIDGIFTSARRTTG